jgi:hypothetical protein
MRVALLLVLLLGACAKVTEMREPDGGIRYLVGCYGALTPMSACYNKAAELCPAGYTVTDRNDTASSSITQQGTSVKSVGEQLVIKCDYPDLGNSG